MPIPSIFDGDPSTERLASYFEELYEYLLEQGVPEDCLPSPWHVLRRVTKAVDHELLREWLDAYVAVEGEEDPEGDGDEEPSERSAPVPTPPRKRPAPSYLRALDQEIETGVETEVALRPPSTYVALPGLGNKDHET
jgi:hypothetical protein